MFINGFHLFLLVTVTRDSAVCQVVFHCALSVHALSVYYCYASVQHMTILNFTRKTFTEGKWFSLFHSYLYHVLIYNCITFVFKTRSTDSSRQRAMIFSRQSVCSVMKSLFKGPGTRHQPFVSAITLTCQNMKYSYCSAHWIMILAFLFALHFQWLASSEFSFKETPLLGPWLLCGPVLCIFCRFFFSGVF